jgi:hypothetical protein
VAADDGPLVELLIQERSAAAVEDFARTLTPQRSQALLPKLAERISTIEVSKWRDPHAPGLVPLWQMIRDHMGSIDKGRLERDLEASIEAVAPKNLALLKELASWFTESSPELGDIFERNTRERLFAKSQSVLVQHYASKPEQLSTQLRGAPSNLLLQACWGRERIRQRQRGIPFGGWPALASTLLAALPLDAETIAPQLSAFITNPRISGPGQWVFDKDQCEVLFGDSTNLVNLLRQVLDGKRIDDRSEAVLELRTETQERGPGGEDDSDDDLPPDGRDDEGDENIDDNPADIPPARVNSVGK